MTLHPKLNLSLDNCYAFLRLQIVMCCFLSISDFSIFDSIDSGFVWSALLNLKAVSKAVFFTPICKAL